MLLVIPDGLVWFPLSPGVVPTSYQNRVPHQALEVPKVWEAARISTNFHVVISANIFANFLPLGWPLGTYVPLSPHGLLDR